MKKKIIFLSFFLLSVFCHAKSSEPDWLKDFRKTFPESQFIAQQGSGISEDTAKSSAAAEIARYFKSSVTANLNTTMTSIVSGNSSFEETKLVDEVSISSDVELMGLEFTECYFWKEKKAYYCVAFINRDEAWKRLKPQVDSKKILFEGFVKRAEKAGDSYTKVSFYKNAFENGIDLMEKLEVARFINPTEEARYAEVRERFSEIPSIIEEEKSMCTVKLEITGDYNGIVENAVKTLLEKKSFTISRNGNFTADVVVNSNPSGDDPIAILPDVNLIVTSNSGKAVYSWQTKLTEKTLSYTLEGAQKKAFPKLAEKILSEGK